MRVLVAGLGCGAIGGLLFLAPLVVRWEIPESLTFLVAPGSMLAFALIHGSQGELGDVAIAAGTLLQFVIFAGVGVALGAVSYLLT